MHRHRPRRRRRVRGLTALGRSAQPGSCGQVDVLVQLHLSADPVVHCRIELVGRSGRRPRRTGLFRASPRIQSTPPATAARHIADGGPGEQQQPEDRQQRQQDDRRRRGHSGVQGLAQQPADGATGRFRAMSSNPSRPARDAAWNTWKIPVTARAERDAADHPPVGCARSPWVRIRTTAATTSSGQDARPARRASPGPPCRCRSHRPGPLEPGTDRTDDRHGDQTEREPVASVGGIDVPGCDRTTPDGSDHASYSSSDEAPDRADPVADAPEHPGQRRRSGGYRPGLPRGRRGLAGSCGRRSGGPWLGGRGGLRRRSGGPTFGGLPATGLQAAVAGGQTLGRGRGLRRRGGLLYRRGLGPTPGSRLGRPGPR